MCLLLFLLLMLRRAPLSKLPDTPLPYTTLFRAEGPIGSGGRTARLGYDAGNALVDCNHRAVQRRPGGAESPRIRIGPREPRGLIDAQAVRFVVVAKPHGEHEPLGQPELNIRSEEHTSELQSLMRISYAVFCLKKKRKRTKTRQTKQNQ